MAKSILCPEGHRTVKGKHDRFCPECGLPYDYCPICKHTFITSSRHIMAIRNGIVITARCQELPERSLNTMSEVIALSSPSGTMKKGARARANERLRVSLFGQAGLQATPVAQPSEATTMLRQAAELRELAARGMKPKAYLRRANELEAKAQGQ